MPFRPMFLLCIVCHLCHCTPLHLNHHHHHLQQGCFGA
ncbi:hypothetical protein CY35_08G123900 [Sphagnum magellanicum]|nr:hypothetical protein CY35_08G123900 [Sphagnum magellanicum]